MRFKKVIALFLSGILTFSQPLPVMASEDYETDLSEDGLSDMIVLSDKQTAEMRIEGRFPLGYSASIEELDKEDADKKLASIEEILGVKLKSSLSVYTKVLDETGQEMLLTDNNTVQLSLSDESLLDGTTLYHEKQDGTWETLNYTSWVKAGDPYIEFSGEDLGTFIFASETEDDPVTKNVLEWNDVLSSCDNQYVDVTVKGEEPFGSGDSIQVSELTEDAVSQKLKKIASDPQKAVFSIALSVTDETGTETSVDGAYQVKMDMDTSFLDGTSLYHECLDGSWEELTYDTGSGLDFISPDGLGTFLFAKPEEVQVESPEATPEPTQPVPEETPVPEITPEEKPEETPKAPEEDDITDETTEESKETPKEESGEIPEETPKADPDVTPEETPEEIPEESPEITPEDVPQDENVDEPTDSDKKESDVDEPEDSAEDNPEDDMEDSTQIFTCSTDDVFVTATVKKEAGIPETAELHADKLEEDSSAYETAVSEVEKNLSLTKYQELKFVPYDVYFLNAGERIEPLDGAVQVEMSFKDSLFGISPDRDEVFAAHIRNDGVVEQVENTSSEKDTVAFEVNSFSIMGPAMISESAENANVAPVIIDNFNASFASGATLTDGKYVWNPTDPVSGHVFIYRVDYTMSGTFSTDKGAFKLEMPLHILKDRDGNWADKFDCPYQQESELTSDDNPDFVYKIDEENNKAVIYNYKPYPTGEAGFIEFSYETTKNTLYYTDMGGSTTVPVKVYATNANSTVTKEAEAEPVYIDTHATISYTQKKTPFLYSEWQDSWGAKPADADDYLYLVWTIRSYVNKNTSPYDFYLRDTFTDLGGSVVGYKFAGQTEYSETDHVSGVLGYGDRYDYVLTRHSKAEVNKILQSSYRYDVDNSVEAIVSPTDHIDADTNAKSSASWWYEVPHYIHPTGHFWSEKWGIYGGYNRVESSEDISDYTLAEFVDGDTGSIDGLKYYTYGEGYPYPWTLGDGADGTVNDALNGLYGQKKVDYKFTDDTFYLEGQKLADADYDLSKVEWEPIIRDATFSKTRYTFTESSISSYKDADNVTIWVRSGSDWKQAAVYDMQAKAYKNVDSTYIDSAKGRIIRFAKNVKGVRFTCTNGYYHTRFNLYPEISLKRTDNVISLVGKEKKVRISNESHFQVTQNKDTLFERQTKGTDYVQKVIRESEIKKDVTYTKNLKRESRFEVTWRVSAQEKYTDNSGMHYIYQDSGKFYDLLPAGAILDPSSIAVYASDSALTPGEYSYETKNNFRNTGRALLTITIAEPTKTKYSFSYVTSHAHASINDYGKNLLNSVAYETGNDRIGEGFPDDGGAITDKDSLKNLDPDSDAERFLYAEARYSINIPVAAGTGLKKQIKNSSSKQYTYETTVHLNEPYSYQVRLTNDSYTQSKDIVFFDSLENFYQEEEETSPTIPSDWKGTLTGVSTDNLIYKGASPVVYLSKVDSMNIQNHHDLTEKAYGEPVWMEYQQFADKYGLDKAKAIAVDATKCADGSDFVLDKKDSVSFDIYMQAPAEDSSDKKDPIAYNNIYVLRTALRQDGNNVIDIPQFYHQDYTKAHYRIAGDLLLKKVDATDMETPIKGTTYQLSGTSDYGTEYSEERSSDKNGSMQFTTVEKGTYELKEVSCSKDWQLNTEVYTVKINSKGQAVIDNLKKNGNGVYIVSDKPRIHADLMFLKTNCVTGGMVKDVKFRLSGTSDYGNDYLLYAVSGENGRVDFEDLELGTYELAETEVPDGIIKRKEPWKVKVDDRGVAVIYDGDEEVGKNKSGYYQIENEPYHSIRFVKSSTYGDGIYLEGAEFSLKGVSDYGTNVDMTATSASADDGGLVVFEGLEPGTYTLKETKAPKDHDLNEQPYTVVVKTDGTFIIDGLSKIKFGS